MVIMSTPEPLLVCPSCGKQKAKKEMYRTNPCEVCHEFVCYECIRRKQILPPSWELPEGTFRYRCKRHVGGVLGIGWASLKPPGEREVPRPSG
jgi:hypothetical protein